MRHFFFFLTLLLSFQISAQEFNIEQFSQVNIDALSDEQIRSYWEKAQAQGYTLSALEEVARFKKMPENQIMKLKQRIAKLSTTPQKPKKQLSEETETSIEEEPFGLTGKRDKEKKEKELLQDEKKKVFGYNFFQNPKISFTPNQNMPTPANYVISTGDELLVEVWGATEGITTQKVDNQGNINLQMVGKVRVSGLEFEQAKQRIESALQRVYSGITAPDGSFSKVYVGVSLKQVRTIKVNIIGEVATPGTYSLSALSTVLNALYACGGPTETGSFRNVKLVRNGKTRVVYDIYNFLINGSEEGNITLNDGDVLIVPPYENQVLVEGSVKRAGIYELREGETLSDLQTFFGGFDANAYRDNLVIERVSGSKREVKEIPFSVSGSFPMKNGDKLVVHQLTKIFQNRLSIGGAVYQPGNYAYNEGLTASDLISKAAGVREEAYLERGIVFRTENSDKKSIHFSVKNVLENKETIALRPNDSIHIFHRADILEKYHITIEGAVKNPMKIPYRKGLKAEDLVLMAGGFREGADPSTIQIGRQVTDSNFKTLSQILELSLSQDLSVSAGSVELQPNDVVTVRFQKGYSQQKIVDIQGEVILPGFYVLENKEERISDILKRVGGFTPYAYPEGAMLVRKKSKDADESEKSRQFEEIKKTALQDQKGASVIEEQTTYRVGINLNEILKSKNRKSDIILQDGDVLIIPNTKQTVEVKGQVLSPSFVRFEPGKSVKSYVNSAGGFANDAKKRSVYVMYANGEVKGTSSFLFFKNYPKVQPGAVVIVPERAEKQRLTTTETVSITTALTTLAILIFNTFK